MKLRFVGGRYDGASGVLPVAFPPLTMHIRIGRCERMDCLGGLHSCEPGHQDAEPYELVYIESSHALYEHRDLNTRAVMEFEEALA